MVIYQFTAGRPRYEVYQGRVIDHIEKVAYPFSDEETARRALPTFFAAEFNGDPVPFFASDDPLDYPATRLVGAIRRPRFEIFEHSQATPSVYLLDHTAEGALCFSSREVAEHALKVYDQDYTHSLDSAREKATYAYVSEIRQGREEDQDATPAYEIVNLWGEANNYGIRETATGRTAPFGERRIALTILGRLLGGSRRFTEFTYRPAGGFNETPAWSGLDRFQVVEVTGYAVHDTEKGLVSRIYHDEESAEASRLAARESGYNADNWKPAADVL